MSEYMLEYICQVLDKNIKVGALVLVVMKSFDRDWHACLPNSLCSYGKSGGNFEL